MPLFSRIRSSCPKDRSAGVRLFLEPLEDRTLLAGSLANAQILSVSDDGRFQLYAQIPPYTTGGVAPPGGTIGPPATVALFLHDQQNPNSDRELASAIVDPLTVSSRVAAITSDGNFVVYVAPDGSNIDQIYLQPVNGSSGPILISSTSSNTGGNGNSIEPVIADSGTTAYVAFASAATNLGGESGNTSAESNVFLVTYSNGTPGVPIVLSQAAGTSQSVGNGPSDSPSIGLNTSGVPVVAYESAATNLLTGGGSISGENIYLWQGGVNSLVSNAVGTLNSANGNSTSPVISRDGSSVAYLSTATNLVANQSEPSVVSNVFLYTGSATILVSGHDGSPTVSGNGNSAAPVIDTDGGVVAYQSASTDLDSSITDNNGMPDVFVFSRANPHSILISTSARSPGQSSNGGGMQPALDPTGRFVAFSSLGTDLVPNESNLPNPITGFPTENIYRYDREDGVTFLVTGAVTGNRQSLTVTQNLNNASFPLLDAVFDVFYTLSPIQLVGEGGATVTVTAGSASLAVSFQIQPSATLTQTGPDSFVIPNGTGPTTLATLIATILINGVPADGQLALPVYSLITDANGDGNNDGDFSIPANDDPATGDNVLDSNFIANGAVQGTYRVELSVDAHVGLLATQILVFSVSTPMPPPPPGSEYHSGTDVGAPLQIGAVDPTSGTWYLNVPGGVASFPYGLPGWIPVTGDWTGAGHTQIGSVDPSTETWHLNTVNGVVSFPYGLPGWIPITGDWSGTGQTQIGAVDPATETWYLNTASGVVSFPFGLPSWIPVTGDWTGTGKTEIGVVNPATGMWYLNTPSGLVSFAYGLPGWKPVTGDWSGAGTTQVGAVDPSSETWYLNTASGVVSFPYGLSGWVPVSGLFVLPASPTAALVSDPTSLLTNAQLDSAVASALALLEQAGINSGLVTQLSGTPFAVGNLPPGVLAEAQSGQILVSADGGGFGWFLDATPTSNPEFAVGAPGSPLVAVAAGREDLLSVVFHELGRLSDGVNQTLTTEMLPPGQREVALDSLFGARA
jgi:hypothetical protein